MAKSKSLGLTDPIDIRKLANVERKARDGLPDFRTSFPQEVQFEVEPKQGKLPKPEIAMGFTLLSFCAMCEFDAQRFTQADMADMLMKLHGVGDSVPSMSLLCIFQLPKRRDGVYRDQGSTISTTLNSDGEYSFTFSVGGFTEPAERRERQRRFAEESRFLEGVFGAVIEAGRLPLRIYSTASSFQVAPINESNLIQPFYDHYDEELGTSHIHCRIPKSALGDLTRRFFDALASIPGAMPTRYQCSYSYSAHQNGRADRCREAYEYARSQRWPVGYRTVRACFRLESAESLEGLVPPFIGKRGVRLPMGTFKLGAKKVAKLFDLVKPDGHHLILQLPIEHQDQLAMIERKLGVSFVM